MTSDLIWTRSDVLPSETSQKQEQAGKRREKHPRRPETNHWPGILGNNPLCVHAISRYHTHIGFPCSHASTLPNSAIRFQVAVSMHRLWPLHTCTISFMIRRMVWMIAPGFHVTTMQESRAGNFFPQCNASNWRLLYPSKFMPAGLKIATSRYSFGNINYGWIFC